VFSVTKRKSSHEGDNPAEDFFIVEKEDWLPPYENNKSEDDRNSFNDNEEEKEEGKGKIHMDKSFEPMDQDDSKYKSFEKFAKFVKMEEHIFTEEESEWASIFGDEFDDKNSVNSAIYNYEYGKGFRRRRHLLIPKDYEHKSKWRCRSEEDRLYLPGYDKIPRNIKRLKAEIKKNNEVSNWEARNSVVNKNEGRQSDLLTMTKEESASSKLNREEILLNHSDYLEEDVEEYLEDMKDPFGKDWKIFESEMKKKSNYKNFKSYRVRNLIFKSNDDLRQELLAIQLIKRLKKIFDEANLSLYLHPYEIIITSHSSGFLECIPNAVSIDSLKKSFPKDKDWTFADFFERRFVYTYEECQKNFVESLAGYSFLCYLFNIKDRHNGNILLDNKGHLIHIDFGFMFSNSPGGMGFESSPFKLTQDYLDIMGGPESQMFEYFKSLLEKAFYEVRKHLDDIISMIEIMFKDSQFPCFKGGNLIFDEIRKRWSPCYNVGENSINEFRELVDRIINNSINNWRTRQYDAFQKWTNNIER
jgi:hypothetical protein